MAKKVVIDVEVNGAEAERELNKIQKALERVDDSAEEAASETKSLGEEVGESGAAISLLDAATGGLASRVRDTVEVYKTFRGRIVAVTAAQIKANLAFLANPIALVTAAVVAATGAFAKFASKMTNDVVPTGETLKNMFLSLGNSAEFARLQAESYTKNLVEEDGKRYEQAIAIAQAYGQDTLELELDIARRRFAILKEGEEGYIEAQTAIAVIRAKIAKRDAEAEVQAREEARQAKIKELEEQQRVEDEAKANEALLQEFDRGADEALAYAEGKLFGEQQVAEDPRFQYQDLRELEMEMEIDAEINHVNNLLAVEEDKNARIMAARSAMLDNLVYIFGAETKLGKAFLVARQIQAANELAIEIGRTITFSAQAAARSTVAVAEGTAQTAKVGFPQNIPLLIGYAAQAAGIIVAIKSAVSSAKNAGRSVSVPDFRTPEIRQVPQSTAPQISTIGTSGVSQLAETISAQNQQPIKAFVVSGEVTTAQSLERNAVKEASI
jgi:hypothetical protein